MAYIEEDALLTMLEANLEIITDYMDPEVLEDPVCYPSNEELAFGQSYTNLPAYISRLMESLFLKARIS